MKALKTITVVLPPDLLDRATQATGKGITATIRESLEAMTASHALEEFRRLRGKVKLSFDVDQLRRD